MNIAKLHDETARPDKPGHGRQGRRAPPQGAIRSTQRAADQALDALSNKVDDLRSQAAPADQRVSSQAEDAAQARHGSGARHARSSCARRRCSAQRHDGRLRQGRADQGDADRRGDRRRADGPDQPDGPFARLISPTPVAARPTPIRVSRARDAHDPSPAASDRDQAASARRPRRGVCRAGRRRGRQDLEDRGSRASCSMRSALFLLSASA